MLLRRPLLVSAALFLSRPVVRSSRAYSAPRVTTRVRPGDPDWPSPSEWGALRDLVDGNLIVPQSPLSSCSQSLTGAACEQFFEELKNPYYIGDNPALTQTCGWVDAWTAQPSAYVVAARNAAHVAMAVNFARAKNLRLVVRGGGHSYLGTSTAPDSLMIWTRAMNDIVLHDAFVPQGCESAVAPTPSVSVGAGAIWMHTYGAVTTGGGRYVQGGGCGTVGVAGLVQGGGFGTYSKRFGTAGSSLLEAEVVTADGATRVVNACHDPDLFWALKGGGGGSFGAVTRMTLRTWDLPSSFGAVSTMITARSDAAYRRLLGRFVAFYTDALFNSHWGELAKLFPRNRLEINMNFQGLGTDQVRALWAPFLDGVMADYELTATPAQTTAGPGRYRWNGDALSRFAPGSVMFDDRPGAPKENFYWSGNSAEAGHVIYGFESVCRCCWQRDNRKD